MFTEQTIIDRIVAQTTYTTNQVGLLEENRNDLLEAVERLPLIRVGYGNIVLKDPKFLWSNAYMEIENNRLFLISVAYTCLRKDFPAVYTNIFNSLHKYTPYIGDATQEASFLSYIEGNRVALLGNKLSWEDTYGLIIPQIT